MVDNTRYLPNSDLAFRIDPSEVTDECPHRFGLPDRCLLAPRRHPATFGHIKRNLSESAAWDEFPGD